MGVGLGGGEAAVKSCPPDPMATALVPVDVAPVACELIAALMICGIEGNGVGKALIKGLVRTTCARFTLKTLGAPVPFAPTTAICPGMISTV